MYIIEECVIKFIKETNKFQAIRYDYADEI